MQTAPLRAPFASVLVVIGGVYWFANQNPSQPTASQTATTTTTLNLAGNAQFPSYITAANGMALYTFNSDTSGVSNCSGICAATWPPYSVPSAMNLSAAAGISGTVGTITRSDGTLQVTYNGAPLYFFVQDTSPGDVTGNGKNGFAVALIGSTPAPSKTTPAKTMPAKTSAPATTPTQSAPPAYVAPAPVTTPMPAPTPTPTPTPTPAPTPTPTPTPTPAPTPYRY